MLKFRFSKISIIIFLENPLDTKYVSISVFSLKMLPKKIMFKINIIVFRFNSGCYDLSLNMIFIIFIVFFLYCLIILFRVLQGRTTTFVVNNIKIDFLRLLKITISVRCKLYELKVIKIRHQIVFVLFVLLFFVFCFFWNICICQNWF